MAVCNTIPRNVVPGAHVLPPGLSIIRRDFFQTFPCAVQVFGVPCRLEVACSQPISCHPLSPWGGRRHALGRYPAILVRTLGVLRVPFGQVACSQPISCHPVSTCGPGGLLPADILPSFGHLAGPGGLLPADNLSSSAVPSVFCACRLGRWHALTRYPAIL